MKGYKVTDASRSKRVGVGCENRKELIEKGCKKLNIDSCETEIIVLLEDGTVVDDEYFTTLPQNTLLLLALPGQDVPTTATLIYNLLKKCHHDFLQAGEKTKNFFNRNSEAKMKVLTDYLAKNCSVNRSKSRRADDPEWFKGLDTSFNTKEDVLYERAQMRIRGYLYKTCEDLKKKPEYRQNKHVREHTDKAIDFFKGTLKCVNYYGCYFDRHGQEPLTKLCDEDGDFYCNGDWMQHKCYHPNHIINPYDSREARIVFSTWNLDHRIERSRTIIPALIKAAEDAHRQGCEINVEYFYRLLFTTANVKLVHIVCHDKGKHFLQCDCTQFTK